MRGLTVCIVMLMLCAVASADPHEESVRLAFARMLSASLFDVDVFASGQEFLDSLERRRPDCVIAPAVYTEMFKMHGDRKLQSGKAIEWSPTTANPKLRRLVLSYILIEQRVAGELLPELLRKVRIRSKRG